METILVNKIKFSFCSKQDILINIRSEYFRVVIGLREPQKSSFIIIGKIVVIGILLLKAINLSNKY